MITKETQNKLTPEEALELLKEGNKRFVELKKNSHNFDEEIKASSKGQFPLAVTLSCIDSRTSSELIFDLGIGDVFSARVAGNVINEDILGSMEYACKVAGSKVVAVIGHTKCGAVTSACKDVKLGNITKLLGKIKPAVDQISKEVADITAPESVQKVACLNVDYAIDQIRKHSPILREMEENGEIKIIGAMHDLETGNVMFREAYHFVH